MFVRILPRSSLYRFIQARSIRSQTRKKNNNNNKEPRNWESKHILVESNPLLLLIDRRCKCISHLKQIHSQMTLSGLISDPFASSRLVAFCALSESRDFEYCLSLLLASDTTNSFSWNTAIRGLSESESPIEALALYKTMFEDGRGSKPDRFTYPLLLKVCAEMGSSSVGFQILGHAVKLGFDSHLFVHNAAIHMLAMCGDLVSARKVFDESPVRDLVSWNSLINGYSRAGFSNEALRLYGDMVAERVDPDEVTMIGVISSCSKLGDLNKGRDFHRVIEVNGLSLTVPLSNALVDMYVKCGDLEKARRLFDGMKSKTAFSWAAMISGYAMSGFFDKARNLLEEMPERDPVPWNAMIGGFVQAKRGKEALDLFREMQSRGIFPDENTAIGILSACSQLGALETGVWIHRYLEKIPRLSSNVAVRTTLVHMYAKCGEIEKALQVFDETSERNALTWTAIICGLASHGRAREALDHFEAMVRSNLEPDEVTFLGVLSACCHGGLVEEGRKYFSEMGTRFGLEPNKRHYSIAVDLLGRAGLLEEAERLIEGMGFEPDEAIWGALFSACRARGDVAMGERAASRLLELDPGDSGNYVLLANMYKEAEMFDKAEKVRRLMRERRVAKIPGCSSIEIDGVVSEFVVRDASHLDSERIYECLVRLTNEIEMEGESNLGYNLCVIAQV